MLNLKNKNEKKKRRRRRRKRKKKKKINNKNIASYLSQKLQCRLSQDNTSESTLPSVCLTVFVQMMGVLW